MSESATNVTAPALRLRRAVHRFYHSGAAWNFFLRRRLRPAGIGLLLIGIVLTCLAGGQASDPIFRLLSFAFTLGVISLLWLPLRRAKLEVQRDLPQHATAGERVRLRYHLKNQGKRKLRNAWLIETPPDPRPSRELFMQSVEPGSEKRNAFDRTFAYYCWNWLCERRLLFEATPSDQPVTLERDGEQTLTAELMPRRRGLIRLDDLRVLLPDPLGLFQRCTVVSNRAATLAVLPQRFRLPGFELPGSARFQPGGDAASRNTGPSGEFVSLRDYQPGDPLRLIDWKSWARTGKPIVKEFEDTFFPRHGLILDTFPEALDEDLFEDAVSVAASFVSSIDTQESLIDLMFISGREQVVTAGRGTGRSDTLLEVLAGVEASPTPEFESLKRLVLRHTEDLAGCLAVIAGWSPERAQLLNAISSAGVEIGAVVVCREIPESRPPRVHFVRSSHLAADLLRLPPRL
ncbi:DUF58 domain-containing protein [Haloferula rosea]|uniref:DUF58 domain-containing protein n=1 Tax=Haloferula rosea TaxID=490093 RepID=A0A934RBW1_9BACT|nr:DUF58 domain-containing protein [Haloferula rosea]MBK1825771.1 DUF58 domain-containing protein [Haloferula rosea]